MTEEQISLLCQLAVRAGEEILKIYAEPFEVESKADGSPVTKADAAAERIILAGLRDAFPNVPVVAEESVEAGNLPAVGDVYFLVDPLDGTKEFLKKNGEFTVNIALIDKGVPVFGVVAAPALGEIYWGDLTSIENGVRRAFRARIAERSLVDVEPVRVRTPPAGGLSVLASRSHLSEETSALIDRLNVAERLSVGSSLKLCWVAAGKADLYPRLAPTMQWDIAAGDAVVRAAGGAVVLAADGSDFVYTVPANATKDDLLNPHFIAVTSKELLPEPTAA
ncbi:3'(2'),5'-bisphosphate nucleotidase CysQ [Roseibium sp.]|uniref:3'(2'),5'-bisphosphate nucleotidase CysQ n=1 Tax=Roseibium sp. TaxID=1936156 RepID=UPI003BAA76DB